MDDKKKVGIVIKTIREGAGLSQEQLAEAMRAIPGCAATRQAISYWEKGKTAPSFDLMWNCYQNGSGVPKEIAHQVICISWPGVIQNCGG
jgi:transcriptional regulator with XRE-family HTH domain